MDLHLASIDHIRQQVIDLLIQFGPKLLTAILIIVAGVIVGGWAERWLTRALRRFDLEPPLRQLLSRVVRGLVLLLFMVMALQNLGVQLLPLVAGLGVAGAGIALAMQGVLSNVVAGLSIILTKPFRVGQYVQVAGVEGQVQHVALFSTILLHSDRSQVVIPNRKIVGEILHNYGHVRQVTIQVNVAYDTDLGAALQVIQDVVSANPRVLKDAPPVIGVARLADSAAQISIQPWVSVDDFGSASAELTRATLEALRTHGVSLARPQHEVRLLTTPTSS
ncbi:MAG TPA: mechanosensitive ion channel family protein [Steroidobacteraceae bacterium]|nr:mechanosensitive ion channel family protein [Steroidobacteraceae bacterium]